MSPISFDVKILNDCAHANQHSESCDQPPEIRKEKHSFQNKSYFSPEDGLKETPKILLK